MKKFFVIAILTLVCLAVGTVAAIPQMFDARSQVNIRFERLDWETYRFSVGTNQPLDITRYQWTVDGQEVFFLPSFQYHFNPGKHRVMLTVTDAQGQSKYDSIQLHIWFWSLHNATMWWAVYAVIILLIVYYWIIKVMYLLNRRKVSRDVRHFLDFLDTHGYVDHMIEAIGDRRTGESHI